MSDKEVPPLSRRKALALLGLTVLTSYAAPMALNLSDAKAQGRSRTRSRRGVSRRGAGATRQGHPHACRHAGARRDGGSGLAKDLLRSRTVLLDEVARRVGYGSASTFSTAFSRHVGSRRGGLRVLA